MKKFKEKMAARAGFTLVELIVVIVILGILAGVAVPAYSGYIKKANEAADITTVTAVKTAAEAALAEKAGPVTEVVVTADKVTAKIGTTVYVLSGTADSGETDAETAVKADYTTYLSSNTISFKQDGIAKATWTSAGWTFSAS